MRACTCSPAESCCFAIRQIGYTNHNLCRRMRGMTSLRPAERGWTCCEPGLVNESSPPHCGYSCTVDSAAIRREVVQSSLRGYKKRQAGALEVYFFLSHHAIKRFQPSTTTLYQYQLFPPTTNLSPQSIWVAAVSAPTPTVLAQPATATARVSHISSRNLPC
jgi:hypothetical protein